MQVYASALCRWDQRSLEQCHCRPVKHALVGGEQGVSEAASSRESHMMDSPPPYVYPPQADYHQPSECYALQQGRK